MAKHSLDPLAAALDAAPISHAGSQSLKIDALYGDRPDVLDSIVAAHKRGLGHTTIANLLTEHGGTLVSYSAVKSWLRARGHLKS